jgi:hypothetical protein
LLGSPRRLVKTTLHLRHTYRVTPEHRLCLRRGRWSRSRWRARHAQSTTVARSCPGPAPSVVHVDAPSLMETDVRGARGVSTKACRRAWTSTLMPRDGRRRRRLRDPWRPALGIHTITAPRPPQS